MSAIWVCFWLVVVYNKPNEHPRISSEELKYITSETQRNQTKSNKVNDPQIQIGRYHYNISIAVLQFFSFVFTHF